LVSFKMFQNSPVEIRSTRVPLDGFSTSFGDPLSSAMTRNVSRVPVNGEKVKMTSGAFA
jgi:hypothetical protein